METLLKLQLYFFCLLVLIVLWFSGNRRQSSGKDIALFRALLVSNAIMVILDSLSWIFDGLKGQNMHTVILLINSLYYIMHTLPTYFFILYAYYQIFRDSLRFRRLFPVFIITESAIILMIVLSIFHPFLFTIDGNNRYSRGPFFPIFALIQYGLIVYVIILLSVNKKHVNKRILYSLVAYPIPVFLASVGQMLYFGLTLIWPMVTVFLVIAFCNIENRRAKTDYLTGTANRRSLDEELEQRIADAKTGRTLGGLLIDIDDFKKVNDSFGHEAGDRALESIAQILLGSVRVEDHVARMGGDEFVVLTELGDKRALDNLILRIENALTAYNANRRSPFPLAMSIGRALYDSKKNRSSPDFLALLDADMYARKKAKKHFLNKKGLLTQQ